MNPLLSLSGLRLAGMIRGRDVTSLEVVEAHINQIQKVNPTINALVKDRFNEARHEAKMADKRIKSSPTEKLPPFYGVPCTVKESFGLEGMPNTSGLVARKGIIAKHDATAVARLRKAGAIPLGVTNVSELCMWMESDNRVYGRSNNPYNTNRTTGGSSGGEGAVIGAGGSPFGLGSDIGGSIRLPSFFNGIFGHKPTGGLVPNSGQFPMPENEALRYCTTGPLARKAEDLMPFLKILAGPDGEDKGVRSIRLKSPSRVKIKGLMVLNVEDNGLINVSEDLRLAQKKCADMLSSRGAEVKKVKIGGLKRSPLIWSSMLSQAGGPSFSYHLGGGKPIHPLYQLIKLICGRSPHTLPAIALAMVEKAPKLMVSRTRRLVETGRNLRQELVELIGTNGVMLFPSYSRPAPEHRKPLLRPLDWVYTAIFNVMELPVTQVPLGLNEEGLPLGVQVVGIHGNDHLTIAVALELEKAFGGWVPPWEKNLTTIG